MINYWWVTRPKRKLNSVPEVLAAFSQIALNQEWEGQRETHLVIEDKLEQSGLKRQGERRDQTGGGARTYLAWIKSLGLIFTQETTGKLKLTLAGEAIMAGDSPVKVLTNQILKYQFPSPFSMSRGVDVCSRFKIRPFRFLLQLLSDERISFLKQDEIAKIIVTEAEEETSRCYEHIVKRVLEYREIGDKALDEAFCSMFRSSKGAVDDFAKTVSRLMDIANTIINWLEYTQLIKRDGDTVEILPDRKDDVLDILSVKLPFIDRPDQQEYFQRKFGVDPKHKKDTRNLEKTATVTAKIISMAKIRNAYMVEAIRTPITKITSSLIETIAEKTGEDVRLVEETILMYYPNGSAGTFMTEYFEMAFAGTKRATEFELATCKLFNDVLGFEAKHVGPIGLTPDVLLLSDDAGYQAIIDNKAYRYYSINNDHHNRMVTNYIGGLSNYSKAQAPLAFYTYIAGGFVKQIDEQLHKITDKTGVNGSAMTVSNMIKLVEKHQENNLTHDQIKDIFSVNRRILVTDLK